MSNDGTKKVGELEAILQEKSRIESQIGTFQQRISDNEKQLKIIMPTTPKYQEVLEELLGLQAYVAELYKQIVSLDEAVLDLTLEQERRRNPESS